MLICALLTSHAKDLGGNFTCTSNRETMMYSATVFNDHLDEAMELLSEVILRPKFSQEEVRGYRPFRTAQQYADLVDIASALDASCSFRFWCSPIHTVTITPRCSRDY